METTDKTGPILDINGERAYIVTRHFDVGDFVKKVGDYIEPTTIKVPPIEGLNY